MRVLITGDRNWNCRAIADRVMRSLKQRHGKDLVVFVGDAEGVDKAFRTACRRLGVRCEEFKADWTIGPGGGPKRNAAMVARHPDFAIAVHRQIARSKGTRGCAKLCMDADVPVYLIDGVNPDRRIGPGDLERSGTFSRGES